jgi:hypothetical protein
VRIDRRRVVRVRDPVIGARGFAPTGAETAHSVMQQLLADNEHFLTVVMCVVVVALAAAAVWTIFR